MEKVNKKQAYAVINHWNSDKRNSYQICFYYCIILIIF